MRVAPDCFPCFLHQIVKTGRLEQASETDLLQAIREFSAAVPGISAEATPAEIGGIAYQVLARVTGIADPYARIRKESVEEALAFYPTVKELVAGSTDKLKAAVKAAIAGNLIDHGLDLETEMMARVRGILDRELAIDHSEELRQCLSRARSVLYLADNAGETVFDRILVEELGKPTTYAVRKGPIINDALAEDALHSGLDGLARIVSSGCSTPGTIVSLCSEEFRETLREADLIISKGQGNYEGLSDERLPVFFLLVAKCQAVARDLGVRRGDTVLRQSRNYRAI